VVPAGTTIGNATLTLQNTTGAHALGNVLIATTAPSLFTANGDGKGVAAATAVQIVLPTTF